jgi:GTP-binding protein Era
MEKFKSGFVSLIGRTNVGKSTLINALTGEKVAIATSKTQTTRTAIKAIVNGDNYQIIITDTPGIHKPKNKLGQTMLDTAYKIMDEVDGVIFLIEADSNKIGPGDRLILDKIKEAKQKCILVINKTDLITKEQLLELINMYKNEYNFEAVVPVSALKNKGLEELKKEIVNILPEGPKYFDDDEYTDQTSRPLAEEIIREKALKLLDQEVPHGIYVEVDKFQYRKKTNGEDICDINANIYCIRESHKGIIIGKNGEKLKRIGTYARQDLEQILGIKVNLKLWVKVSKDWQEKDNIVKRFKLK